MSSTLAGRARGVSAPAGALPAAALVGKVLQLAPGIPAPVKLLAAGVELATTTKGDGVKATTTKLTPGGTGQKKAPRAPLPSDRVTLSGAGMVGSGSGAKKSTPGPAKHPPAGESQLYAGGSTKPTAGGGSAKGSGAGAVSAEVVQRVKAAFKASTGKNPSAGEVDRIIGKVRASGRDPVDVVRETVKTAVGGGCVGCAKDPGAGRSSPGIVEGGAQVAEDIGPNPSTLALILGAGILFLFLRSQHIV